MTAVVVNKMKLISKKHVTVELAFSKAVNRDVFAYNFQVTDVISTVPIYSIAVTMGCDLQEHNKLTDIGPVAEAFVIKVMSQELKATTQRKLIVIDITNFPFISTYVDYRDQTELHKDTNQFSRDVIRVWSEHAPNTIPTIIVNVTSMEAPSTTLKLLPVPS